MDFSLQAVTDDGDMPWSDSNSMVSDDGFDGLSHSPWAGPLSAVSTAMSDASNPRVSPNCQLSPISNEVDQNGNIAEHHLSHAEQHSHHAMMHSGSSCTGSWDIGCDDAEDMTGLDDGNFDNDINWDQASEEILTVPKEEPRDEDELRLDDVKEAPASLLPSTADRDRKQDHQGTVKDGMPYVQETQEEVRRGKATM
jgi:hypothetical protein